MAEMVRGTNGSGSNGAQLRQRWCEGPTGTTTTIVVAQGTHGRNRDGATNVAAVVRGSKSDGEREQERMREKNNTCVP